MSIEQILADERSCLDWALGITDRTVIDPTKEFQPHYNLLDRMGYGESN